MNSPDLSHRLIPGARPVQATDPMILKAAAAVEVVLGSVKWVTAVPGWATEALTDPDDNPEGFDDEDWGGVTLSSQAGLVY